VLIGTAVCLAASHLLLHRSPRQNQPDEQVRHAPSAGASRPFSLNDLKELENPNLKPVDRAVLGLRFYQAEAAYPTPYPRSPYTDFRTHDYVLARITARLAETGADVGTLRKAWERAEPGEIKDSLMIFLVLKGQVDLKEPASAYVLDRRNPMRLRELAVVALGKIALKKGHHSLGRVLARVIQEDSQAQYIAAPAARGAVPGRMTRVYPVRRAAVEAIYRMRKEGLPLESYVIAAVESACVEVEVSTGRGS
jgi:hypothetical protein